MDRFIERARAIADSTGLLHKAAEISAARGLTGAAAVEHASGLYLAGVSQLAADLEAGAAAERVRIRAIMSSPSAAQRPGLARQLALETAVPAADAIKRLESSQLRAVENIPDEAEAAARFILEAGE